MTRGAGHSTGRLERVPISGDRLHRAARVEMARKREPDAEDAGDLRAVVARTEDPDRRQRNLAWFGRDSGKGMVARKARLGIGQAAPPAAAGTPRPSPARAAAHRPSARRCPGPGRARGRSGPDAAPRGPGRPRRPQRAVVGEHHATRADPDRARDSTRCGRSSAPATGRPSSGCCDARRPSSGDIRRPRPTRPARSNSGWRHGRPRPRARASDRELRSGVCIRSA